MLRKGETMDGVDVILAVAGRDDAKGKVMADLIRSGFWLACGATLWCLCLGALVGIVMLVLFLLEKGATGAP